MSVEKTAHLEARYLWPEGLAGLTPGNEMREAEQALVELVREARAGQAYARCVIEEMAMLEPAFIERARLHYGLPESASASDVVARFL